MALYPLLRPLLFRLDPERAHTLSLLALRALAAVPPLLAVQRRLTPRVADPVAAAGLAFPNRVGLAAGYDKNAVALAGLAALGFGHLELGTVTPRPQPGNPRPRLFRLVEDRSLINRLGFPGEGEERVAARLRRFRRAAAGDVAVRDVVVGINLGKQKDTPLERAADDYLALLEQLAPLADYATINVSSPNTPGLRQLEAGRQLASLAAAVVARRDQLAAASGRRTPLFFKLSPDLADEDLEEAVEVLAAAGVDGLVATNTTLSRDGARSPLAAEAGGLSGALLAERSTRVVARAARSAAGRLLLVGAGGIVDGEQARRKREAGAELVQLYSGLVYRGPALVGEVARALAGRS